MSSEDRGLLIIPESNKKETATRLEFGKSNFSKTDIVPKLFILYIVNFSLKHFSSKITIWTTYILPFQT